MFFFIFLHLDLSLLNHLPGHTRVSLFNLDIISSDLSIFMAGASKIRPVATNTNTWLSGLYKFIYSYSAYFNYLASILATRVMFKSMGLNLRHDAKHSDHLI